MYCAEAYTKLRQVSQFTSDQLQSRNSELNHLKRKIEKLSVRNIVNSEQCDKLNGFQMAE
jgi:hypothetical protein